MQACGGLHLDGMVNLDLVKTDAADVVADICHLPFRDKVFDTVVCRRVIQHIADDKTAVAELHRVSSNIVKIQVSGWIAWLYCKLGFSKSSSTYKDKPFHIYTQGKLRRMLKSVGFNCIIVIRVQSERSILASDWLVMGI